MNFLDKILGKKNDSVIGVDIGSSAIKIVQIKKKKGKAVLETYGELALGPYAGIEIGRATSLPMDKIAEALSDVLREANTTTKQCGITLPLSSSLITFMTVPTTDDKQLGGMVTLDPKNIFLGDSVESYFC
jgi:type IV pilus assembly protein PilM